jgi:hypothetical protein
MLHVACRMFATPDEQLSALLYACTFAHYWVSSVRSGGLSLLSGTAAALARTCTPPYTLYTLNT